MFDSFLTLAGRFLDPLSLLLVVGGALLVAAARSTRSDVARALAALGPLFRADPEREAQAARVAVNGIKQLAQAKGLASADRVRSDHAPGAKRFLRAAANRLSDADDADAFARWADEEVAARLRRHQEAIAFWQTAADAAPGMGMIGTVAGLIDMFANMDDPAKVGPGMALAMLTTFYGVVFANLVAGPIAARLERLSAAELDWQRETLARLATLAREQAESLAAAPPLRNRA
ncbi:MAG: MotA/TolQ/ExbB proton channel family protein [Sphingomonadaceae bacterium]|nr:MotA/TolQ/ExbB proton channel family protein [Sphingomonadaceae bacterium]